MPNANGWIDVPISSEDLQKLRAIAIAKGGGSCPAIARDVLRHYIAENYPSALARIEELRARGQIIYYKAP